MGRMHNTVNQRFAMRENPVFCIAKNPARPAGDAKAKAVCRVILCRVIRGDTTGCRHRALITSQARPTAAMFCALIRRHLRRPETLCS